MSRWWRAHASALDDPKVQRLAGETFKAWFNLLCVASLRDGILPPLTDIAFALRRSESATTKLLEDLQGAGLLDQTADGLMPHNWNGRQYKSDVSNDRVKRHRERQRNADVTGDVTLQKRPQRTETEADTEQTVAKATARRSAPDAERFKLPADWQPSQDGRDYARDKGLEPGSTAEAFSDYFTQGRGRAEKRDGAGWEKRWRVWCNTDAERKTSRVPGVRSAGTGGDAGAFARAGHRLGDN